VVCIVTRLMTGCPVWWVLRNSVLDTRSVILIRYNIICPADSCMYCYAVLSDIFRLRNYIRVYYSVNKQTNKQKKPISSAF